MIVLAANSSSLESLIHLRSDFMARHAFPKEEFQAASPSAGFGSNAGWNWTQRKLGGLKR